MGENTERIRIVAKGLKPLQHEIYFVGGAVVSLYADQIDLFDHRSTEDVDVLVKIVSRGKYMILQERLREFGFREDHESSVICRWKYQGVTVDIMPLSIEILGFSNRWYAGGIKNSVLVDITDNMKINIFSYPYFMASKFEALANRKVDWRYSKDFEDIIKTLEARKRSIEEIRISDHEIKSYLKRNSKELLNDMGFLMEAIGSVLYPDFSGTRIHSIVTKLEMITRVK